MDKSTTNGVGILIQPTTKFQTNLIECHFLAKIDQANFTELELLSRILASGCQQFPQSEQLAAKLADLYGANLQITHRALGGYHDLMVRLAFVEPQVPADYQHSNLQAVLALLQQLVFASLMPVAAGERSFQIERQALASELRDLQEDFDYQAFVQTKQTYFAQAQLGQNYRTPATGSLAELTAISYERLQALYQEILQHWQVAITVLTNDQQNWPWPTLLQQALPFTARPVQVQNDLALMTKVADQTTQRQTIPGQQSRLTLAYQVTDVRQPAEIQRFSLLARVLGGSEQSLLFQMVREQLGLVYDISASYDALNNWLLIEAGLDQQNIDLALTTIDQAWQQIKHGQTPADLIQLTQQDMISQRRLVVDSPQRLLNRTLIQALQPATQRSATNYAQAFAEVDPAFLGQIAQQAQLRVTTILQGQGATAE
ncbi:M16 family metallopeptidase [Lapidilactobacillus wuchangensis]|uniref:M16 family metallopeptidase n=1 Tax=Lapidilactobacillus wuchangensis TaxID=2486001 RepID=UPI000F790124|nr:insulinase family protein [Lapidilactobacillus wuchangensis]